MAQKFLKVHVQVRPLFQVYSKESKPMVVERGVTIVSSSWDRFFAIVAHVCTILEALGIVLGHRILGALGTIFEAPFPRFGQSIGFR